MATVTADQTYRGTITENGTVTVTGRGRELREEVWPNAGLVQITG